MTTEATPAGVYVRDTNGARHWVWRDTIQKQLDWVEKHGGTAQLTTGVVRDKDQLVALMAAVKDSARAAWLDGSYREAVQ